MVLSTEFTNETNPNSFNFFFDIKASPKNAIEEWEVAPYQMRNVIKLKLNNFVIAEPKEKIRFKIKTNDIVFYYRKFNKKVKLKNIKIIYEPSDIDKERNLSPELMNMKIYNKKIISKKFRL